MKITAAPAEAVKAALPEGLAVVEVDVVNGADVRRFNLESARVSLRKRFSPVMRIIDRCCGLGVELGSK